MVTKSSLSAKASGYIHPTEEGPGILFSSSGDAEFGGRRCVASLLLVLLLYKLTLDQWVIPLVDDVIYGIPLRHHVHLAADINIVVIAFMVMCKIFSERSSL